MTRAVHASPPAIRQRIPAGPWLARAACRGMDPELFYPERGASTREAKDVCGGCPARTECGDHALVNAERFGIWGGLSERERRAIRRRRRAARGTAA